MVRVKGTFLKCLCKAGRKALSSDIIKVQFEFIQCVQNVQMCRFFPPFNSIIVIHKTKPKLNRI